MYKTESGVYLKVSWNMRMVAFCIRVPPKPLLPPNGRVIIVRYSVEPPVPSRRRARTRRRGLFRDGGSVEFAYEGLQIAEHLLQQELD